MPAGGHEEASRTGEAGQYEDAAKAAQSASQNGAGGEQAAGDAGERVYPAMGELGGFLKIHRKDPRSARSTSACTTSGSTSSRWPRTASRRRVRAAWTAASRSVTPAAARQPDPGTGTTYVYRGRWRDAIDALHATKHFPEFTGRICPAPCETACVLDINDDAVTIKQIEQSIIDRAFDEGWVETVQPPYRTGKKVAVVGSGPSGLAAAAELTQGRHTVTLFERNDRHRRPAALRRPDSSWTRASCSGARHPRAGRDRDAHRRERRRRITADQLRADFDAVVLTIGSTIPRDLPVPGRELDGVHFAMEYLEQRNRYVAGDDPAPKPISAADKTSSSSAAATPARLPRQLAPRGAGLDHAVRGHAP